MAQLAGEDKLKHMIRNISRTLLSKQGVGGDVRIKDVAEHPKVCSHWMVMILISGPKGKITFKTHFKSRNAMRLAGPLYGLAIEKVSPEQALDCMREYCNLTAGGIKRALSGQLDFHLSLPIITRGFDELFFIDLETAGSITDRWQLVYEDNEISCSSAAEFFEPIDLTKVDENFDSSPENSTEVEYL